VAEDVEVDLRGPFELQPGDTFILCSDGLHGLVKEPELKEIAAKPIEAAADEFLRKALERGAPDNVTVIVARVEEEGSEPTLVERMDETQPLDMLDETQKDTQKLVAVTPAEAGGAVAFSPPAVPVPEDGGLKPAAPPVRKSSPLLVWMILAILAGSVAGAWYYWTYAVAKEPARSTPR
jgi:hypothetical protein